MTARLDDASAIHHVYHIRVHRSREPVRDDDRRAAAREFAESFEPVGFSPRIERARWLVENDDRRASQKSPRECDALPLTNTQFGAARKPTSQQCLLFLRQTRYDTLLRRQL